MDLRGARARAAGGASSSLGANPDDSSDILAVHAWLGSARPPGSIVVGLDAEDWPAPAHGGAYPYVLQPDGTVQILSADSGALSFCAPTLEEYLLSELLGPP